MEYDCLAQEQKVTLEGKSSTNWGEVSLGVETFSSGTVDELLSIPVGSGRVIRSYTKPGNSSVAHHFDSKMTQDANVRK